MKIIDAHIHMSKNEGFDNLALQSGHINTIEGLTDAFTEYNIVGAVAMGSGRVEEAACLPGLFTLAGEVDFENYQYPKNIGFCIGVNPEGLTEENREETLKSYEQAITSPYCVGFKIYLGYRPYYAYDERYTPVYRLAQKHNLTVAFHSGDTARASGRLKFAHPLTIDEVAVEYPDLRLVICHFGSPWLLDAAEVAKKNENVYIELSGLGVGKFEPQYFLDNYPGFTQQLKCWLEFLDKWDKVLYGTDWPLVSMESYIGLMKHIIPQPHWEKFFYQNALTAYPALKNIL